jgi:hypothetical protein
MASQRQLEANRANAKRSTGPRSARGKARSRMNAVTHGLTAARIVIPGEKAEEFAAFRDALMVDLAPANTIHRLLADRVAGLFWRLRRGPMVEAALLKGMMRPNPQDLSGLSDEELDQLVQLSRKAAGLQGEPSIADAVHDQVPASRQQNEATTLSMLSIFLRHETSLMNELIKTLRLLRTLQAECAAAEAEANTIDGQPGKRNLRAFQ